MVSMRRSGLFRAALRQLGGERFVLAVRIVELPLRLVVRAVVSRFPRDPSLLVFGAALGTFADNPAYLFLHLSKASPTLRCVWISDSKDLVQSLRESGFEAELRWSARGVWTCVRAGWYVVGAYASDVNRWFHDGARLFNLWHGIPLKAIERDIVTGPLEFKYRARRPGSLVSAGFRDELRSPDYVLSTSEYVSIRCFSSAFGVGSERCLDLGYPRTDHFFREADAPPSNLLVSNMSAWERLRANPFVVGYFPTWRDDGSPIIRGGLSLDRLAKTVTDRGGVLVFKAHGNTGEAPPHSAPMLVLDPSDDLSAYLHLCSALITDYSSVAFDFMLLNRPILYYVPDLEDYRRVRGLYFTPEEMMPGPLLRSPDELCRAVQRLDFTQPPDARMAVVRAQLWDGYRGGAAARISAFFEDDQTRRVNQSSRTH
jgi:CDP-glycerol glycerophosphotransferase (TagB/SpsB family)